VGFELMMMVFVVVVVGGGSGGGGGGHYCSCCCLSLRDVVCLSSLGCVQRSTIVVIYQTR
jgi:hypothetical protein